MSRRTDSVHIFHVYRKDGTAVFLHPLKKPEKLYSILDRNEIVGHYGNEPRVEALTLFRNELYRLVEQEVKSWVAEAKFIPRFLISAGVFLVAYVFMAAVIRIPFPIVDELAVATGSSILAYILIGRRNMQSEAALKRRIFLRTKVDAIVFSESSFVKLVENELIAKEGRRPEELVDELLDPNNALVVEGHEEEAEQLVGYLTQMLASNEFKQTEKRIKRLQREQDDGKRDTMKRWLETRKLDLPLLSLYFDLKRKDKTGA
jgi:hypothetical protein